ncbi:fumarylacetoacetate hydrolase family protein [Vibrio neonatus]|uniref:fumarylacetoacetate hydrolase family protein n=1 Tax=Vibrio neonatus TaxID=278860 RepID=UPI0021C41B07|nr:fumarylacetoacetate hydrolase family protein [Vibrio neonatus]
MKWIGILFLIVFSTASFANTESFIRFEYQGITQYGKLENNKVYPIVGDIFTRYKTSENALPIAKINMKLPTTPEKVFAVGMNFASHLSSPSSAPPPLFLKLPSSLILSGEPVFAPKGATNLHFEGELVLIIGKTAKNVSIDEAKNYIWGVTVGNDLTERSWQGQDLQWMRAKASDGFGPIAATMTRGVNFNDVLLTTRLNGKVVQQESTKNMIHSPEKVVSYLSQYFTLKPGDLIFMGTPGRTKALNNKDVVSVSIEGVGEVENPILFAY